MVSIIIPTYNRANYLKETLLSILNQSYTKFEIIIIDDASTDDTKSVIMGLNSDKIRYINKGKIGVIARLRNLGIKESKFDHIAFCDDDDLWHPDKLDKQMECLKDFDFVCTDSVIINEQSIISENNFFSDKISGEVNLSKLLLGNFVITSSVLMKKNIFKEIELFNEGMEYYCSEDYDLWLRICSTYKMYFINEKLISYRKHSSNSNNFVHREQMLKNVLKILNKYQQSKVSEISRSAKKGEISIRIFLLKLYKENNYKKLFYKQIVKLLFNLRYFYIFKYMFLSFLNKCNR